MHVSHIELKGPRLPKLFCQLNIQGLLLFQRKSQSRLDKTVAQELLQPSVYRWIVRLEGDGVAALKILIPDSHLAEEEIKPVISQGRVH
jgi:hypothetical protein